jgi:hypothetical protein
MLDLHDKLVRGRVLHAVKTSREAWRPFCRTAKELIRDHVGSWYQEKPHGARYKTLVNLINQTARIYMVALAANNPRVKVRTENPDQWPFAQIFQVALNKLISDMQLHATFRAIVLDAFFSIGCGMVQMRDTPETRFHGLLESEEDVWLDPGEPWFTRIPRDHLILDMAVRELSKMRYCGHIYRADFEKVMDEPGYNKEAKKLLSATPKNSIDDADFAQEVGTGGAVDDDELKPMLWLMDLWVAENKSVVTFGFHADAPPLIERRWKGSQGGPYKFLGLGLVPDNIVPVSPAANLKGLHDLANRNYRKMARQADNQRTVNAYKAGAEDDAARLRDAKEGDWIQVRNPQDVNQLHMTGVDPGLQAFQSVVGEQFNMMAGNVRAMGGLGQQASTLGQEEIIQENVSRIEADMNLAVMMFADEVCTDLGYLMWNDLELEIPASVQVPGSNIYVDSSWPAGKYPGSRVGKFEDYGLDVIPYSTVFKTPRQQLNELFATIERLAPLWPMFQASGASLDAQELLEQIADLLDRPELKRIITFATPANQLGGDQNTIRQSPVTSRENIRRNVPTGGTPESRASILQQVLGGGGAPQVTPQQMASMGRGPA